MSFLLQLQRWGDKICIGFLTLSLATMLGLTLLSLVLRWFQVSFLWLDPLVRHVVFLSAFFGGVQAISRGQHIAMDLLSRYLHHHERWVIYHWHQKLIGLVSLGGVLWLLLASWPFVVSEWNDGGMGFLGIHSGVLVSIIPFGLALLALRFLLELFLPVKKVFHSH